ncbi:MAG TPA: 2-dehydropantoate 2-reductase [Oceanipulchritudo sp.]|nr:2-dehydropantoate 2-reductase [Oceanipulchritudo sp.]
MAVGKGLKVGIIGSGALGSYFGMRLAVSGQEVGFLLRSDYAAVKEKGMKLILADGEAVVLKEPQVYRTPEEMGSQEMVLIGLKTTRNALFEELLPPVVRPGTILVTVQNGLGNVEQLQELFPENPVIGALCQIGVNREGPGRIRNHVPGNGFVQLGAHPGSPGEAVLETCLRLFEHAGIRTRQTASLGEALWRKLMWNVPFNGLTVTIGGKGTDAVCGDPELRTVAVALMEEIRLAANALGFAIEPEYVDKLMGFTDKLGAYQASTVLDWLEGRPLEVEAIFRKPLEAGTRAGVPMPRLEELVKDLEACSS